MKKGFFSIILIFFIIYFFFLIINQNHFYYKDDSVRYLALKQEESFSFLDKYFANELANFYKTHNIYENYNFKDIILNNFCKIINTNISTKLIDENTKDYSINTILFCKNENLRLKLNLTFNKEIEKKNNLVYVYDLDSTTKYIQILK